MARGGKRKGAGRKTGSTARVTAEARKNALASGISPLEYMLAAMRDDSTDQPRRDHMAIAAAPYVHARGIQIGNADGETFKSDTVTRIERVIVDNPSNRNE